MRYSISVLVFLLTSCSCHAQTFKQSKACSKATAGAANCASITPTAGDTFIIALLCNTTACTETSLPSDTKNTWTRVVNSCQNSTQNTTFYGYEADNVASGATTVALNYSAGYEGFLIEYSGLAASAFDKSHCGNGGPGQTSLTSGNTATTTSANELLVGLIETNSNPGTFTWGLTNSRATGGVNFFDYLADQNVTSKGAYAATATSTNGVTYGALIMTFASSSQPAVARHRASVIQQ